MKPQPNILLILTDQQRFDTIQALNSSFNAKTPNMDFLVQEGVAFENCFCTAPICSPSRATIMTGLYPSQVGMPGNLYDPCPPLSPTFSTVGNYFRSAGYETVYHGKWHMGGGDIRNYGFEKGEECSYDQRTTMLAAEFWRNRDWIEHERPFLHIVSLLNPHDLYFYDPDERIAGTKRPWQNLNIDPSSISEVARSKIVDWPEEQWGAYTKFYTEQIERADTELGELLHQFKCSGFYSNSWIIFAADHGDMAGEHNIPFKGPYMYDGVVRVPLIIIPPMTRFLGADRKNSFTHNIKPGKCSALCSLTELLPTMLDIAGIEQPATLPGKSLLPLVRRETNHVHDAVFAEWHNPPTRMIRTQQHKYVLYLNNDEELYDIQSDPHETCNLTDSEPTKAIKTELRQRLDKHIADTKDPFYDLDKHNFIIS